MRAEARRRDRLDGKRALVAVEEASSVVKSAKNRCTRRVCVRSVGHIDYEPELAKWSDIDGQWGFIAVMSPLCLAA